MSCFKYFCCGYSLKTGGSFIGYYSIATYIKLTLLCLFFLWCIRARIGENEGTQSFLHQLAYLVQARPGHRKTESSLQELKTICVILTIYIIFLFAGILSASCLITGTKLKEPNYLWWWMIYQGVFIVATAVVVLSLVQIQNETFGFLTHLKNYVLQIVFTTFILISLIYFLLLIYFWFNVLSLYIFLKKQILKSKKKSTTNEGGINLPADIDPSSLSRSSIQLIPINLKPQGGGESEGQENGKFFILYV